MQPALPLRLANLRILETFPWTLILTVLPSVVPTTLALSQTSYILEWLLHLGSDLTSGAPLGYPPCALRGSSLDPFDYDAFCNSDLLNHVGPLSRVGPLAFSDGTAFEPPEGAAGA